MPGGGRRAAAATRGAAFRQKVSVLLTEGVVALFDRGGDGDMAAGGSELSWQQQRPDGGTIFPSGAARATTRPAGLPEITLAVEHYNRMVRMLDKGVPVKVELNVETKFYDETTPNGFNIDRRDSRHRSRRRRVVLLGAHFDSHPYATGATDNAAGGAAMMEAMRILKAVGASRGARSASALWGGEEQGLLGSRAYVREHLADPATMALKPEHAKLSAYFNSDNGTGQIRGIWMQGNLAVRPIFDAVDGAAERPRRRDSGAAVGDVDRPRGVRRRRLPGVSVHAGAPRVQLAHAPLEHGLVDRVQRDDMMQQATVVAVFAYNAAQRDEKLPRKPLPAPQKGRGTAEP